MNEPYENDERFANRDGFSPVPNGPAPYKHSGLGIASFVLSIVSIVSFVVLTIVFVSLMLQSIDPSQLADANGTPLLTEEELVERMQPYLGYMVLYPFLLLLVIVGLILGIVALARPGTKKIFAILGTVFNGLPLLFFVLLMLIGLAAF
ncbi:hypothetical protein ACF3MZ_03055 [Paenibacillaceae bacterium WGS1546]|uniref:hypothetical protein n=1 Tax=Cohnella sp. WGS1546 TaxID=3366810 RepID=UPI00372D0E2E